jgi:hypothetical protein
MAVYAALWFVTENYGVPQVRTVAIQAMEQPVTYAEGLEGNEAGITGPIYRCSAGAVAPFFVRTTHSWQNGASGASGSGVYLWLFGRAWRIREALQLKHD